jgi:hypothetical protein
MGTSHRAIEPNAPSRREVKMLHVCTDFRNQKTDTGTGHDRLWMLGLSYSGTFLWP